MEDNTLKAQEVEDTTKFKSRNFCLLLYPLEDSAHESALDYIKSNYRYASITHDRDTYSKADEAKNPEHNEGTLKKSHVHVVVQFSIPRWSSALAKELSIPQNYIQQCRSLEGSLKYLVHADHSDKTQYDTSEVDGPLRTVLEKCLSKLTEDERIQQIIDIIWGIDAKVTFTELSRLLCSKGLYADFRRSAYIMSQILAEHNSYYNE